MRKIAKLITAGALCAACFMAVGCSSNESEPVESDKAVSEQVESDEVTADIVEELNPVGEYQFDSIALETDEGITAAGIGAEWNGEILDENYAHLTVAEDGTLTASGALNAAGMWGFNDGVFGVTLNGYTCCGCSIDSDGLLNIDIETEEGVIMFYYARMA